MATPVVSDQSSRNVERVCQVEASHHEQPNLNSPRPAAKKRVVGFDCEFVERPPKAFQVDCPVCLLVVREPHQVTCCGYSFCQPCINRVERDKKPCPTCNEAAFSVFPNKGLRRAIYEHQVLCGHQKLGCQWVGELRELDDHLNESPILGRQFVGCEFAEVECNDCGKSFQRQHFKAHQLEQHLFSCEYCHNYESYFEDVVKNHYPICGFYPVPCPNECGVYPERENLDHHVSKECPLTVVYCDFHYAGCELQFLRIDMPAHLTENLVPHMAQLATYNQKKVQEKDQQIMQLTEDLRKETKVNRQKIDRLEVENEGLSKSLLQKKDEIAQLREDLHATTENIAELKESAHVKEETLKQESESLRQQIYELRQKYDTDVHQKEEATKLEIAQLTKKCEDIVSKGDDALRATTDKITELQEILCVKEEALKQEISHLRQKQDDTLLNLHKIEEATKQELVQLVQKQDVDVTEVKQEQHKSENKIIARLKIVQEDVRKQEETLQHEVAAFRHVHEDAVSKSESMKREIGKIQGENETLTVRMQNVQEEVHRNEEMRRQEMSELRINKRRKPVFLESDLTQPTVPLEVQMPDVTHTTPLVDFTMTEFEEHKRNKDIWYSEPFYTHPRGYKLHLQVYANGNRNGKNTHVSVGVCLMRGDFDNDLSWPFCGDVSVMLLNQKDKKNSECQTVHFSLEKSFDINHRVIDGESAPRARIIYQFLPHNQLGHNPAKNCQFLKDDCLCFRVTQVFFAHQRVVTLEKDQLAVKEQCLAIESRICVTPFRFTMRDFEQQKTKNDIWYSPSFYTHPQGYRMCLRVYANGYSFAEDTHVSVFFCLMRGEWDNYLKWPFRGDVNIQLLNQIEDKEHYEKICDFSDDTPDTYTVRATATERAQGWGWRHFISHRALNYDEAKNCQYLKYDSLQFRIVKVELKN